MNMDSTLVGAMIGAVIAIISVYITARQTLKNSSKLEEQKIIRQKREEAYLACERCRNSIASQELTILKFVANAKHVPGNKFEPNNVHPHNQLRMLIFLYIPELKQDMEELDKLALSFQRYYSFYVQAEIFLKYTPEEKNKFIDNASSIAKKMYETIEVIKQKLIVK
ncbi:TPA: hypothetical protein L2B26_005294 [Klebsiella oxytoca]|uniref:hypothetical protein n=1 Tax=Klebsiella oxytoca TaxID=571 RepID=UPI001158F656|nr:hypothetical protein [Klebsiella oxytoca]HDX8852590.1 hypothetical protein [Klebsiella michiganensis]MDG9997006.1 hypothetical protein [Klebsiella oxytoca]MDU4363135.1 hypothetical protein [Klebsiella oxytoca]HBC7363697.1 hypothetical protein [Klebsiella oxytoca]HBM3043697.1 hypothetical protein [Klebsiella oxytoca]